jgi:hypothetical protein
MIAFALTAVTALVAPPRGGSPQDRLCEVAATSAAKSAAEIDSLGQYGAFHFYSRIDLGDYRYKVLVSSGDSPQAGVLAAYRIQTRFDAAAGVCGVASIESI